MVAAVLMAFKAALEYEQRRARILDIIDWQIKAEMFTSSMNGAAIDETEGCVVPAVATRNAEKKRKLERMTQDHGPALRDLVSPDNNHEGESPSA